MKRLRVSFAVGFLTFVPAVELAAQDVVGAALANSLIGNVARIRADDASGFAFIVGLGSRELILATAYHTLERSIQPPEVCFALNGETCVSGRVISIADPIGNMPGLDLAFIAAPYPEGLSWRPDVAAEPATGMEVRSVGRGTEWYVPDRAGRIASRDEAARTVTYTGLTVAEGVSGAPIVSDAGIVAMHIESLGEAEGAKGIVMAAIRERLIEQARQRWILVPRAQCADADAHRRTLEGRAITLHFDAGAPDAAMGAAARLLCLGARVSLRPAWGASNWPGSSITYSSGDLRLGRTAQTVLAGFGRIDARLGQPQGDLEIWIR